MILNDSQKKAIIDSSKYILLLAGAGSGKTRTIIEKIKHILNNRLALESEILAITFTNKAAFEMKNRLNNENIEIATFHKFCLDKINIKNKRIIEENTPFDKRVLLDISRYKNKYTKQKPFMYDIYQEYLRENNFLDFDDMLLLFQEKKNTFEYKYIFVDEFQDTNNLQYQILKQIKNDNTNIFVVGDPDQSIYAFRGSDIKIINTFITEFNAKVLTLNENYRSSFDIINLANKVIIKNKNRIKKSLIANNTNSSDIMIRHFKYKKLETEFIISEMKKQIRNKIPPNEICVLSRNHSELDDLKEELEETYLSDINILTIHQAKGLEFMVVFIIGLEEKVFPANFENRISELYEERRLLFVGITRAKQSLYLLSSLETNNVRKKQSLFYREMRKILAKK